MLPDRFNAGLLVLDALEAHPGAADVFIRLGYRCVAKDEWCVVIEKDTLAEAARLHEKPLDELLSALNGLPPAPQPGSGQTGVGGKQTADDRQQ